MIHVLNVCSRWYKLVDNRLNPLISETISDRCNWIGCSEKRIFNAVPENKKKKEFIQF